jgi:hypothetical protein
VNTEVEVELTTEDIRLILEESGSQYVVLANLSRIVEFIDALSDDLINSLKDSTREKVAEFFIKTADRFKPKTINRN